MNLSGSSRMTQNYKILQDKTQFSEFFVKRLKFYGHTLTLITMIL